MLKRLSLNFSRDKARNDPPLLEDYDKGTEMNLIVQREDQDGLDKDKELFHDSEIDRIDIQRGQKSRKRFMNRVFNKDKAGFLLDRVDVGLLTHKRKHCIIWILHFCTLLFILHAVISFKLILSSTSSFSQGVEVKISINESVSSMVNDLKAEPLMDIQLIDPSLSCPNGYENMLLGEWSGTSHGCFCPSTNTLFKGDCASNQQFLTKCRDIPKIDPVELYSWNGVKWCVKRAQDYVKQSLCPTGYTSCSFGLCMKESLSCPITSINMIEGQENSFTILRETNKPPLARVGVFLQNSSCLEGNSHPMGDNPSFILLNKGSSECNQYGLDGELNKYLDQQKEEAVLKENKAPGVIYSLPLYYETLKESEATLYKRRKIEITQKAECLNIDFESILSKLSNTGIYGRLKLYIYISLSIMGLSLIFGWICVKFKKDLPSWVFGRWRPLQIAGVSLIFFVVQIFDFTNSSVYVKSDWFECFSNSSLVVKIDYLNSFFRLASGFFVFNIWFSCIFPIVIFVFVSVL